MAGLERKCFVEIPGVEPCTGIIDCPVGKVVEVVKKRAVKNCDREEIAELNQFARRYYPDCLNIDNIMTSIRNGSVEIILECSGEPTLMLKSDVDSRENV